MTGPAAPLPADDPVMIAWQKYKKTDGYKNDCRPALEHRQYVEGALWTAFIQGYAAADAAARFRAERDDDDEETLDRLEGLGSLDEGER